MRFSHRDKQINRSRSRLLCSHRVLLPMLEPLEERRLMSAWVEQGPGPILNAEAEGIPGNPVVGAIESVVPVPGDPNTVYVGATSGGVWKTTNATASNPTWTPLTDLQLPNLMISSLAMSPVNSQVLFAGGGSSSSGGSFGNTNFGLARSTNAGASWTLLTNTLLASSRNINRILPTTLNGGQTVLLSDGDSSSQLGGIYRSTDNGTTMIRISGNGTSGLPAALTSDLAGDPGDPNRFYAAVPGLGIYASTDGGVTWTAVNNGLAPIASADRILLATHHSVVNGVVNDVVYAALMNSQNSGPQLLGVFRSTDQGAHWTAMGTPAVDIFPVRQSFIHGALVADPANPNIVFISGDAMVNVGAAIGSVFRGDFSLVGSGINPWQMVVDSGANASGPHPDSRSMVFDANGNMLESNDGGIYRLSNPDNASTRIWGSVMGNLRVNEAYTAAYDPVSHVAISGSQDIGVSMQNAPGGYPWTNVAQGDGGAVAVDGDQTVHPGVSVRYFSFPPIESTWNANNVELSPMAGAPLNITSGPGTGNNIVGFDFLNLGFGSFVLNNVSSSHMLLGTKYLYESLDGGNTIANLGTLNGLGLPITAMAYGANFNGSADAGAFYVATGPLLYHRAFAGGPIVPLPNAPRTIIVAAAMDPQNMTHIFLMDNQSQVWGSFDEGNNWTNLTANLSSFAFLAGGGVTRSDFAIVDPDGSPSHTFLLVGGRGGVFKMQAPGQPSSQWVVAGQGMPHVVVTSIQFIPSQQMVVASTFGRGVWTLTNEFGGGTGPTTTTTGTSGGPITTTTATAPGPVSVQQPTILFSTTPISLPDGGSGSQVITFSPAPASTPNSDDSSDAIWAKSDVARGRFRSQTHGKSMYGHNGGGR